MRRMTFEAKTLLVCAVLVVAACVALAFLPSNEQGNSALLGFLIGQGAARR